MNTKKFQISNNARKCNVIYMRKRALIHHSPQKENEEKLRISLSPRKFFEDFEQEFVEFFYALNVDFFVRRMGVAYIRTE